MQNPISGYFANIKPTPSKKHAVPRNFSLRAKKENVFLGPMNRDMPITKRI